MWQVIAYIGETSTGIHKQRANQHKAAFRQNNHSNAFFMHAEKDDHLPSWTDAKILANEQSRMRWRLLESALIATVSNFNQSPGSLKLAKATAKAIFQVLWPIYACMSVFVCIALKTSK